MNKLGPDAQLLVHRFDDLEPVLRGLRDEAAYGFVPGLVEGIDAVLTRLPQVKRIVAQVASAIGDNTADAGLSLASRDWTAFFDYLESDARPLLIDLGKTIGNIALALADIGVAFGPLTRDFSTGLLGMSRALRDWAAGLEDTQGFQDFTDYVEKNAPRVLDLLGSLSMLLVEIAKAAAPVGSVVVPMLTELADVLRVIVASPAGPTLVAIAAGIGALGRALALLKAVGGNSGVLAGVLDVHTLGRTRASLRDVRTDLTTLYTTAQTAGARTSRELDRAAAASSRLKSNVASLAKGVGAIGGLALIGSGAADKLGVTNTATLALTGALVGGAPGAIAGGLVGAWTDLSRATNLATDDLDQYVQLVQARAGGSREAQIAAIKREIAAMQELDDANERHRGFLNPVPDWMRSSDEEQKVDALKKALKELEFQGDLSKSSVAAIGTAAADAAPKVDLLASAVQSLDDTLKNRASLRDYEAAIDTLQERFKRKGGATFDVGTEEGRADLAALDAVASTALQRYQELLEQGDKLKAQRVLERGIKDLQDFADKSPAARRAADDLLEHLRDVAKQPVVINVDVTTTQAEQGLASLVRRYDGKTIKMTAQVVANTNLVPGGKVAKADGGTLTGERHPYGDKFLYWGAPGEEVVSNRFGQADKNRAELKAANAGAKLAVVGYADGGTPAPLGRSNWAFSPSATTYSTTNYYGGDAAGIDGATLLWALRKSLGELAVQRIARQPLSDVMFVAGS
ncbi:MAG: hypothetical protein QM658_18115 [Gordonia sp. (in: high G+C Gram-positive bacteria)]